MIQDIIILKETRETDDQLKTLIIKIILIKLNKVFHLIIERNVEEEEEESRQHFLSLLLHCISRNMKME